MTIEGKKKWTVTIITFATAIIGASVTTGILGEESADTIIQAVSILAPLVLGIVYNIMQGRQDEKKAEVEKAKVEQHTEEIKKVEAIKVEEAYPEIPDFIKLYEEVKVNNTDSQGIINWFQVSENVKRWMENEPLDIYHPDVRLPLAKLLISIGIDAKRHEFFIATGVTPEPYTYGDGLKVEALEKAIRDAKQHCETLSAVDRLHIVNLGNLYEWQQNIEMLQGKSIKWSAGYNTVKVLGSQGMRAIG